MSDLKQKSFIPQGDYCYRVVEIQAGEILNGNVLQFGKELREFRYHGNMKEVLCPYFQRTNYGTVRCNFLDKEYVDEDDSDAIEKIIKHLGIPDAKNPFDYSWALSDEIKICGINEDEDTECDV